MIEYNNGTLYTGNIIRNKNGEKIIAKENTFLIYSKNEDCFYSLDVLNYLLDLEINNNLTDIQRKEYQEIVDANKYQYKNIGEETDIYIDYNSIEEAFSKNKTK